MKIQACRAPRRAVCSEEIMSAEPNPVALVTGASRGIGRGIALALAGIGHNLVINYAANETAARATATDCRGGAQTAGRVIRAEICQADISSATDRKKLIAFTRA